MSEIIRRTVEVAAKTAGNTLSPVVTALMTTAAVVTQKPELAVVAIPAGAFAGAVTEQGLTLISDAFSDRAERVQHFADTVEAETGQPIEDFVAQYACDGPKRELLGRLVEAAASSHASWKVKVLAKAFVRGAKDGDLVDETLMFVSLLSNLEAGHVRVLAAIAGRRSSIFGTMNDVADYDPGLKAALPFLRRDLLRLDLINESMGIKLTDLGRACASWLADLGATDDPPTASGG